MENPNDSELIHECLRVRCSAEACERCPVKASGFYKEFLNLLEKKYASLIKEVQNGQERRDIIADFVSRVIDSVRTFEARWNEEHQRNAGFRTWAERVFLNTKSDHFRRKKTVEIKTNGNETNIKQDITREFKNWWRALSDDARREIDSRAAPEIQANKSWLDSHRKKEFEHRYISGLSVLPPREPAHPYYKASGSDNPVDLKEIFAGLETEELRFLLNNLEMQNEGLTQKQMARRCGLSTDAYKQRKSRAIKALREQTKKHGNP